VWDLASGTEVATTDSREGPVTLSPDGTVVAVTGAEPNLDDPSVVTLLEADTLEPIRSMQGDAASLVTNIVFDPQGSQIATDSGTLRVWDVRTGEPTFTPPVEASSVEAFEFTPDGSGIVVLYEDGKIRSYPIALDDAIAIARSRVTRSLTDEECQTYLDVPTCPSG
jgi:WD40 repeat protein